MKRKLLIGIAVFALTLTTALAVLVWQAGTFVSAYRPQIEQKLSEAIGAEVTVGNISFSLFPHPQLALTKLEIKSREGAPPGLTVAALHANAALLPLFAKRLELSSISIDRPEVSLERSAQGEITVQGLKRSTESARPPASSQIAGTSSTNSTTVATPLSISIDEIHVSGGSLTFLDKPTQKTLTARNIELDSRVSAVKNLIELSDTSLALALPGNQTLSITTQAVSIGTASKGLAIMGGVVKTPAGSATISGDLPGGDAPGRLEIAANDLGARELVGLISPILPALSEWNLSGRLGTKLSLLLTRDGIRSITGPISLSALSATPHKDHRLDKISGEILLDGSLADLGIRLPSLSLRYNEAPLSVVAAVRSRPDNLAVQSLTIKAFEGTIEAPATVTLGAPSILSVKPVVTGLSITSALKAFKPALANTISGTVTSFRGDFSRIALNNPSQTASGAGTLELRNGVLKGFNIPHQVLSNINNLPFLPDNLRKKVPPEFEAAVSKPDMIIQQLSAQFAVAGGIINISALRATSDIFTLQGAGTYSLSGELTLTSDIIFTREFSKGVTDRVKELKPLADGDGRLVFPIMLKGRVPAVVVVPNIAEILKRTSLGTLRDALSGALKGGKDGKGKGALGKILGF